MGEYYFYSDLEKAAKELGTILVKMGMSANEAVKTLEAYQNLNGNHYTYSNIPDNIELGPGELILVPKDMEIEFTTEENVKEWEWLD